MNSNNLPFNPYNNKNNIEQTILKLTTKFNKICYLSNKDILLDSDYDKEMKKNSENIFMYYFNKIRIYYLNHKRCYTQLKNNIYQFKIDRINYIQSKYSKKQKKSNSNFNNFTFSGNSKFTYKTTFKKVENNIKNAELSYYQSFLKKIENQINNYNLRHIENNNYETILDDTNINRNSLKKYIEKNKYNKEKIYKSRKLFKKLYRKISVKTHPDKIKKYPLEKQQFYKYLFMKSKKAYKKHIYYILILIAVILNIKNHKLHWPDKCMLDMEIEYLIKSRITIIQNKLFNYTILNENEKMKIIKQNSI